MFQATTTAYTNVYTIGSTDLNALTLNIPAGFDMNQLRVGDVVTAAKVGTLNPNATGTPGTPGYDPSLNYTIVNFDPQARTVELSLPVAVKTATTDTFTFAPPQYVVRSSDAPAATGTAGTIPYLLNFNVPSAAITNISNVSGKAITITTGSTVGLTPGQQITISGLKVGLVNSNINGTWTITNITSTGFDLAGITGAVAGKGGPTGDGSTQDFSAATWTPANGLQFAQTVYDVMQTFSLLKDPAKQASRSALLLTYIIGGNTGAFVQNNDPSRQTTLPDFRTAHQLRDEVKSLLRGVYSFNAVQDQSQWYPNPATPTPNATLNGSGITFGIYNLDPYVWFVHRVLNNSSYGFSFDDDVANAQAASSSLEIAVGGNAYTAPPPAAPFNGPNVLQNPESFSPFAEFGTQTSQGYIDTNTTAAKNNFGCRHYHDRRAGSVGRREVEGFRPEDGRSRSLYHQRHWPARRSHSHDR